MNNNIIERYFSISNGGNKRTLIRLEYLNNNIIKAYSFQPENIFFQIENPKNIERQLEMALQNDDFILSRDCCFLNKKEVEWFMGITSKMEKIYFNKTQ